VYQEELLFAGRGNGKVIRKQISAKLTREVQEQFAAIVKSKSAKVSSPNA
jgi:hypothetical protein